MTIAQPASVHDRAPFATEILARGHLCIYLQGAWKLQDSPSDVQLQKLAEQLKQAESASFNTKLLGSWDSGLLVFLRAVQTLSRAGGVKLDLSDLPSGVRRLLKLASATPSRTDTDRPFERYRALHRVGVRVITVERDIQATLAFVGESVLSLARVLSGRARFNFKDLWPLLQECGPRALPIVTLVSFLVGVIIAYMGAVQMQQFGVEIFIADLVGLATVREMSAIMTGVVVAGRSGAAFAAQLGAMQVNEEIDALKTLGISPIDYLVLPRLVALTLMVPLLTIYANAMGMLGGMVVAVGLIDLNASQYLHQLIAALDVNDFIAGLIKAVIYGVLIAIAGCMRGMQSGRDAQAVGAAATSAVVTSIVFMVVAAAILAVVYHHIGL